MQNIKKDLKFKVIIITISALLLSNTILYSYSTNRDYLRVPLSQETLDRMGGVQVAGFSVEERQIVHALYSAIYPYLAYLLEKNKTLIEYLIKTDSTDMDLEYLQRLIQEMQQTVNLIVLAHNNSAKLAKEKGFIILGISIIDFSRNKISSLGARLYIWKGWMVNRSEIVKFKDRIIAGAKKDSEKIQYIIDQKLMCDQMIARDDVTKVGQALIKYLELFSSNTHTSI